MSLDGAWQPAVGELPGDELGVVVRLWSNDPRRVGRARSLLRGALTGWGLSCVEDTALLVLSELLTNAGRHAHVPGQKIETRYIRTTVGLRIEVHDGVCKLPTLSNPGSDQDSGRGLWLVDALADRWDVSERAGLGKVVWADLSAPAVGEDAAAERQSRFVRLTQDADGDHLSPP